MTTKLSDQLKPNPEDYGFVKLESPLNITNISVGEWTVDGGEARYYEDLELWDIAQEEEAFKKDMAEASDEDIRFEGQ